MDAIKHNEELLGLLKEARKMACAYQEESEGTHHSDVVCLGTAIEAVKARLVFLKKKIEEKAAEKKAAADKAAAEKKKSAKPAPEESAPPAGDPVAGEPTAPAQAEEKKE